MKNSNNQSATKGDILLVKNEIKLVKDDLQKDINRLDKKIEGVEKSLKAEIRISIKESEDRTDEKAQQYRDQILTKMDNFLGEINESREERVAVSHQIGDHSDRIENLETDVSKIKSRIIPQ